MNTQPTEEFQWIFDDDEARAQSSLLEIAEGKEIVDERSKKHDDEARAQSSLLEIAEGKEIVDVNKTPVDRTETFETLPNLPLLAQFGNGVGEYDDEGAQFGDGVAEAASTASLSDDGQRSLAPMYAVREPYLGTTDFPPVPEPPVNTAPRPVTIVWGFVVMAIGVLAISFAAGAAVDLGLVLVWLPAICGIALIAAAILAAAKGRKARSTL